MHVIRRVALPIALAVLFLGATPTSAAAGHRPPRPRPARSTPVDLSCVPAHATVTLDPALRAHDDSISALQSALGGDLKVDGVFGPATATALAGAPLSGQSVLDATFKAADLCIPTPPTATLVAALTGVASIQDQLTAAALAARSAPRATITGGSAPSSGGACGSDFACFRACTIGIESGGNYSTNTGNGYYGAWQFDQSTWISNGGTGNPADATPAQQDAIAQATWQARGNQPWGGRC